jgi:hypothetical protein
MIAFHFPFAILHPSFVIAGFAQFRQWQMENVIWQMENEKPSKSPPGAYS